jgi:hypothetical protein
MDTMEFSIDSSSEQGEMMMGRRCRDLDRMERA